MEQIRRFSCSKVLAIYSTLHFFVDLSGIFLLTALVMPRLQEKGEWIFVALLYNFAAFALPMPFGILADFWNKNALFAALGCALMLLSYLLFRHIIISVLLLGIGNGIFHLGGGIDVLNLSDHRCSQCGIFISTGALGVFFGNYFGTHVIWLRFLIPALFVLAILLLLHMDWSDSAGQRTKGHTGMLCPSGKCGLQLSAAITLFFVVCIRSYYGMILKYSWKSTTIMSFLFVLCVVFGKIAGGILADSLGIRTATKLSLLTAAFFALFSFSYPLMGMVSIFFFNMTMPLTLRLLAQIFPDFPGFSFGILTFAIFMGFLPTILWSSHPLFSISGLAVLCILSLWLLFAGIRLKEYHQ